MAQFNTIYQFASQLNASARANQFKVHINFPLAVKIDDKSSTKGAKEAAEFLTHQASLPSYNTDDIPVWYRGRTIHEAGEKTYEPWTCTIYNSADFRIRQAIESWASLMHHPEYVAGFTSPGTYKSTIAIQQLDRNGNSLRVYVLYGAYPTSTGQIELSFQNGTEIETFQATFVYDYFVTGGEALIKAAEKNSVVTQTVDSIDGYTYGANANRYF